MGVWLLDGAIASVRNRNPFGHLVDLGRLKKQHHSPTRGSTQVIKLKDAVDTGNDWYDEVCTGDADEDELNSAVAAVQAGTLGAGEVLLSEGTLWIQTAEAGSTLDCPVTIRGQGVDKTIIKAHASLDGPAYLLTLASSGIYLKDLTLDGYGDATHSVNRLIDGGNGFDDVQFDNVKFMRTGSYAIEASNAEDWGFRHIQLDDCKALVYASGASLRWHLNDLLLKPTCWGVLGESGCLDWLIDKFDISVYLPKNIAAGTNSTLNGGVSAGDTTITLLDSSGFTATGYVRIAVAGTTYVEYRAYTDNTDNVLTLTKGLKYDHATGVEVYETIQAEHGFYIQGSGWKLAHGIIRQAPALGIRASASYTAEDVDIMNCLYGGAEVAGQDFRLSNLRVIDCGDNKGPYGAAGTINGIWVVGTVKTPQHGKISNCLVRGGSLSNLVKLQGAYDVDIINPILIGDDANNGVQMSDVGTASPCGFVAVEGGKFYNLQKGIWGTESAEDLTIRQNRFKSVTTWIDIDATRYHRSGNLDLDEDVTEPTGKRTIDID